jgi:dephospho-CoA kinase
MPENRKITSKSNKMLIGITGNYCAGKNHVATILEKCSIPVLDIDKLGHEVIEKEKQSLLSRFGEDILGLDGIIDRKRLGDRVFGKPNELSALEEIIHPAVNRETIAWIDGQGEEACAINAALLHRSSAFEMLDAVIIVKAPFIVRLLRAKKRDRLPLSALLKRFGSQRDFGYQLFKGKTDIYIVENSVCFSFFCSGPLKASTGNKLEKRINEILSDIFSGEKQIE